MERAVRISEAPAPFVGPCAQVREDAHKYWGLRLTHGHISRPPMPPHTPAHPVDEHITTLCITTCQPPKRCRASHSLAGVLGVSHPHI